MLLTGSETKICALQFRFSGTDRERVEKSNYVSVIGNIQALPLEEKSVISKMTKTTEYILKQLNEINNV